MVRTAEKIALAAEVKQAKILPHDKPKQLPALQAQTPMGLLQMAVSQNADLDKIQKLMELQERWEAGEAKKAFVRAMTVFKKNPPTLVKNKRVHYKKKDGGDVDYTHVTLDRCAEPIAVALSAVGISHHWIPSQEKGLVRITCRLTHEMGHSEDTPLEGPPDDSAGKGPVHAVASTVTLLERYTLLAATGLSARNTDVDGGKMGEGQKDKDTPTPTVSKEQIAELTALAKKHEVPMGLICSAYFLKYGIAELHASKFEEVKTRITQYAKERSRRPKEATKEREPGEDG